MLKMDKGANCCFYALQCLLFQSYSITCVRAQNNTLFLHIHKTVRCHLRCTVHLSAWPVCTAVNNRLVRFSNILSLSVTFSDITWTLRPSIIQLWWSISILIMNRVSRSSFQHLLSNRSSSNLTPLFEEILGLFLLILHLCHLWT